MLHSKMSMLGQLEGFLQEGIADECRGVCRNLGQSYLQGRESKELQQGHSEMEDRDPIQVTGRTMQVSLSAAVKHKGSRFGRPLWQGSNFWFRRAQVRVPLCWGVRWSAGGRTRTQ